MFMTEKTALILCSAKKVVGLSMLHDLQGACPLHDGLLLGMIASKYDFEALEARRILATCYQ